jgi:hypothetical protein
VLRAYRDCCAVCRLRHEELLDAAHILPDGHPRGEPVVRNGLALCKLHHAAFDRHILGIRSWTRSMGRCFAMGCRGSTASGSTRRARRSFGPPRTSWPSGSSCSGRRGDGAADAAGAGALARVPGVARGERVSGVR